MAHTRLQGEGGKSRNAASALQVLLGGCVDYAGLFPPAALPLEQALDNHATAARGLDAWMLGCFVLPTGKLAEVGLLLANRFDAKHPLRVSALGAKPNSVGEFLSDLQTGLRGLADFQQMYGAAVAVEQYEAALPTDLVPGAPLKPLLDEVSHLVSEHFPSLRVFCEVPFGRGLRGWLQGLAAHSADSAVSFGGKLRTGGLTANTFPASIALASALVAARNAGVALKFTAGLHHPFRHFDAGVKATMHGFVNVFAAGIFAHAQQADVAMVQAILEDETPANFRFDADGLHWQNRCVATDAIAAGRRFVTSFGSCSFEEPTGDLRAARLLL